MEQTDFLVELDAQTEEHGYEKVLFLLDDEETKELYIKDVMFDGTYIAVKLGLPT